MIFFITYKIEQHNKLYYQRNREIILNRAKDYYKKNKKLYWKPAKNKYRELSEEEKSIKREYGRNKCHYISEENKQRLKELSWS